MYRSNYTADDEMVESWLLRIQFGEYIANFIESGYDMATITKMTPEDLIAIGITNPNHRRILKTEIQLVSSNGKWSSSLPDLSCAENLYHWLYLVRLEEYYDALCKQGYNTIDQVASELTWEDFEDVGIVKLGHQKRLNLAIKKYKKDVSLFDYINKVSGIPPSLDADYQLIEVKSMSTNSSSASCPNSGSSNNSSPVVTPSNSSNSVIPSSPTGTIKRMSSFSVIPPPMEPDLYSHHQINQMMEQHHKSSSIRSNSTTSSNYSSSITCQSQQQQPVIRPMGFPTATIKRMSSFSSVIPPSMEEQENEYHSLIDMKNMMLMNNLIQTNNFPSHNSSSRPNSVSSNNSASSSPVVTPISHSVCSVLPQPRSPVPPPPPRSPSTFTTTDTIKRMSSFSSPHHHHNSNSSSSTSFSTGAGHQGRTMTLPGQGINNMMSNNVMVTNSLGRKPKVPERTSCTSLAGTISRNNNLIADKNLSCSNNQRATMKDDDLDDLIRALDSLSESLGIEIKSSAASSTCN